MNIKLKLIELANADAAIDVLWLYGSRARGNATPISDWDLAIAFNSVENAAKIMHESRLDKLGPVNTN